MASQAAEGSRERADKRRMPQETQKQPNLLRPAYFMSYILHQFKFSSLHSLSWNLSSVPVYHTCTVHGVFHPRTLMGASLLVLGMTFLKFL